MPENLKTYVNQETAKDILAIAAICYTLIKAVEGWRRKRLTDIVFPVQELPETPEA